jgi:hypothetical protein
VYPRLRRSIQQQEAGAIATGAELDANLSGGVA